MDSALLAFVGLLATVAVIGVVVLGLVVHRQQEQISHLGAAMRALAKEWKSDTGLTLQLDPSLIGEPPDVIAPDEDKWTKIPTSARPWNVREPPADE